MATISSRNPPRGAYMRLIEEFPLRRITTASDHDKAKRTVLRLSSRRMDRGASDYLDVLVDLISDYERRPGQSVDASTLSLAELIRHRLEERGLSASALARLMGIPQSNLSEMLNDKRDWSKAAIRGIHEHLNVRIDRFFS